MFSSIWNFIKKIVGKHLGNSIKDIPLRFRTADQKEGFILWLSEIPILDPVKRSLIKTWSRFTGVSFTANDYLQAGLSPPGE